MCHGGRSRGTTTLPTRHGLSSCSKERSAICSHDARQRCPCRSSTAAAGGTPPSVSTVRTSNTQVQAGLITLLLQSGIHITTPANQDQSWLSDTGYSKIAVTQDSRNLLFDLPKALSWNHNLCDGCSTCAQNTPSREYMVDMIFSRRRSFFFFFTNFVLASIY